MEGSYQLSKNSLPGQKGKEQSALETKKDIGNEKNEKGKLTSTIAPAASVRVGEISSKSRLMTKNKLIS